MSTNPPPLAKTDSRLISGTFLGIDHWSDSEGTRFQENIRSLDAEQWRMLVQDMHGIGIDTLIFQQCSSSRDGHDKVKAYYKSRKRPRFDWIKGDTFGAVVAEATALGMKIFYGVGDMHGPEPYRHLEEVWAEAAVTMHEISEAYGTLPSFGGWYWTWEYPPSSTPGRDSLREIVPRIRAQFDADILIAPNADRGISATLLSDLDVDIIAYQDTVGLGVCPDAFGRHSRANRHETLARLPFLYEQLKYFHDAWQPPEDTDKYWNYYTRPRGRTALWNDLEIWEFDHRLSLHPTELSRVVAQLELTAPYVEKQTIYQYPGLMQNPDRPFSIGGERAITLYESYAMYRESILKQSQGA